MKLQPVTPTLNLSVNGNAVYHGPCKQVRHLFSVLVGKANHPARAEALAALEAEWGVRFANGAHHTVCVISTQGRLIEQGNIRPS